MLNFTEFSACDHGFDCVDRCGTCNYTCVNDLKEIAHMDVFKVSKDSSVLSLVFEI